MNRGAKEVGTRTKTTLTPSEAGCSERLARFFPGVDPVQVRAVVTPLRHGPGNIREKVLVEFASPEKAIFASKLPLEFDDPLRLRAEGSGECKARVVAVQYHEGRKAVAVQFSDGLCPWVNRP